MVKLGQELFSKRKHETIMVVGSSMIFDNLFKSMIEKGNQFTVIVVDTSPLF
jgi:translation initiation factor 2B subunit (eIF-2B alpha/beta/delta family)